MANEDVSRGAAAAPSDPLDAALARMEAARTAAQASGVVENDDELDVDDDETTETVTTADDEPDDDDFDDEDDSVEANTPDDPDDDEEVVSQERQTSRKSTESATPADKSRKTKGGASEDDEPRLSRRERGKLIEELRQEVEAAETKRKQLEADLAAQRAEDERLEVEVNRALGTEDDFNKAMEDGLAGDTTAAEKARIWKANREFYKKLVSKAKKDTEKEFTEFYWKDVADLPGVDKGILGGKPLSEILAHLYQAGVSAVEAKNNEQVERLQKEVETWKGRYRALKPKSGSNKRSPVSGGGITVDPGAFDWKAKYLDPKTGLPTDEFDNLVRIHGIEAVTSGKIKKAR